MLTTVTPAASSKLTTVARLREEFPSITVAAASDTLVERWIDRASAMAVNYCRRPFAKAVYREVLSSPKGRILLERTPASAITITEAGTELVADTDYFVDEETWQIRRLSDGEETSFSGAVQVDYSGGYIIPADAGSDLPADVEYAVQLYVAAFFAGQSSSTSSSSTGGLKREVVDGVGTREWYQETTSSGEASSSNSGFSPEYLLEPFRRYRI